MNITNCSRCGEHKLELMKSYCFCWECGFSPEDGERPFVQIAEVHKFFHKAPTDISREQIRERVS